MQELGPLAREQSLPFYQDALPAHDQFHAKRVHDIAIRLAEEVDEPVDRGVLKAAAWFHDIGRPRERTGEIDHHGDWAADRVAERLPRDSVSSDQIEAIKHCLSAHSIRSASPDPVTVEAKLLFDADKLDALGAHGLVRLACIVGERSGRASERYAVIDDAEAHGLDPDSKPDIALVRDWARERRDALYTEPGRRLGESRWELMEEFFDAFRTEIGTAASG